MLSPLVAAPTIHHEALDWATRAAANGGTISTTTIRAVSEFCRSVDSAGIRGRFLRLNLFCGGNLSGALVPLYRAASFGASVIGNATDTNNNFVSGDYAETGSTGGLIGNGTSKSLLTGVVASTSLTMGDSHLGAMIANGPTSGTFPMAVGCWSSTSEFTLVSYQANSSQVGYYTDNSTAGVVAAVANPTGLFIGSSISTSDRRCFLNGSQSGSTVTTLRTTALPAFGVSVLGQNRAGTIANYSSARISTYSIGLGMTAAQVAAYNTALAAFRVALGRA